jgi:signal peptidase
VISGRGLRRGIGSVAIVAFTSFWFVLLRPVALGGPASYVVVSGVSMEPHLHTGDLVIAQAAPTYRTGDVVAYRVPAGPAAGSLIIHRIIGGDASSGYLVQGDNKNEPDPWKPKAIDIIGRSWLEFPGSGRLLLALRTPTTLAIVLGTLAAAWFFTSFGSKPKPKEDSAAERAARP